jgi:signal transduction histidine kinase
VFVIVALLVGGGLLWTTIAALRLEHAQAEARIEADVRLALWRLDSRAFTILADDVHRPFPEYRAEAMPRVSPSAQFDVCQLRPIQSDANAPWLGPRFLLLPRQNGIGKPAPNLVALLGLQWNARPIPRDQSIAPWSSMLVRLAEDTPQVAAAPLPTGYANLLNPQSPRMDQSNTAPPMQMENQAQGSQAQQPFDPDTQARIKQAASNRGSKGGIPQSPFIDPALLQMAESRLPHIIPEKASVLWFRDEATSNLIVTRSIQVNDKVAHDVVVMDWPKLQDALRVEVADLLPGVRFQPIADSTDPAPHLAMTAFPIALDPASLPKNGSHDVWTPLRTGLGLAWLAALLGLCAVALGGWSLLSLSERRINFVSAVTHELRTPLTTLRLYLDMLAGGMVPEEAKRTEYLNTLNAEADRLNRLVGNVLAFSRLENQRPRLECTEISIGELLQRVHEEWSPRCVHAGKELVVDAETVKDSLIRTDVALVSQILGNLIDNACKYSVDAKDPRIWLRALAGGDDRIWLEVQDQGEGVPVGERRTIFRAFRRGRNENVGVGGVGLGLALARRWADFLGGTVSLQTGERDAALGACFRLDLPRS